MPELRWSGKQPPSLDTPPPALRTAARLPAQAEGWRNQLLLGDCGLTLRALRSTLAGQVNVAYLDPPFDTGLTFASRTSVRGRQGRQSASQFAYDDRWRKGLDAYLQWLYETFLLLRDLLHPRGSLFVHLDWHAAPHARLLLDEVLSPRAFRAEIVWRYRRWPTRTPNLQRMHDTLLYYARDPDQPPVFHTLYEPLADSTRRAFGNRRQQADFSTGTRRPGTVAEESPGAPLSDVWDIGILAPSGHERVGYPTQKPLALLERVIQLSSDEGDLVLDCCCGSGTTLVAAERLNRRWIGADVGPSALATSLRRLLASSCRPLELRVPLDASPALTGRLGVDLDPQGAQVTVTLRSYRGGPEARGLAWVAAWAIDWDHDGQTFRAAQWFTRAHRDAPLERSATHRYRGTRPRTIAIAAIDLLGNVAWWRAGTGLR